MIKYEEYQQTGSAITPVTDDTWYAQTFTPSTTHYIGRLRLWLGQTATPTSVTVSIRGTTAGKPSGSDLVSASITVSDIPLSDNPAWVSIKIPSYRLVASMQYAIVLRSAGNITWWGYLGPDPAGTYTGGQMLVSTNAGVAWTDGMIYTSYDMFFEEWGVPILYPTDAITRVTNLIHRYNRKEGVYTLEMALGEVTSDFGLPEWLSKPMTAVANQEVAELEKKVRKLIDDARPGVTPAPVMPGRVLPRPAFIPGVIEPAGPEPVSIAPVSEPPMIIPTAKVTEERPFILKPGILREYEKRQAEKRRREIEETRRIAKQIRHVPGGML